MALSFYIMDTETNGLSPKTHEINQISIIRCKDKVQRTVDIKIEHPERSSPQALQIQGKTINDLKKGISKLEAIEEINSFILEDGLTNEHRCMVAHNAQFDRNFMFEMWRSAGYSFPANCWLCSKEFSRKLANKKGIVKPKLNLQACLEMTGIKPKLGAHNATVDSANTYSLWEFLMNENLNYVSLIKRMPHEIRSKDEVSNDEKYESFE